MFNTLKYGIRYLKVLPHEKVLLHVYPEARFQLFIDYAKYWFPPLLAFLILGCYVFFNDTRICVSFLITAMVSVISIFCCYYYMGVCALTKLNEKQLLLYSKLCMSNQRKLVTDPNKFHLAQEMTISLKLGYKEFLELI